RDKNLSGKVALGELHRVWVLSDFVLAAGLEHCGIDFVVEQRHRSGVGVSHDTVDSPVNLDLALPPIVVPCDDDLLAAPETVKLKWTRSNRAHIRRVLGVVGSFIEVFRHKEL